MRRKASSIRATSSVSPTPSMEAGRVGPGRLRSTFSISSISVSSGANRRRRRTRLTASASATAASTRIATSAAVVKVMPPIARS